MSQRPDSPRSGFFSEWQPEDFGPADPPQAGWQPAEHVHDADAGFATWRQAAASESEASPPAWQSAEPEAEARPAPRNLPALRTAAPRPPTPRPVAPQQALVPWTDPDAPLAMAPPPYMGQPLYPPPVQTDPRKATQHALEMIRRRKGLILLTFLAFFAGVVAYTFTATPRYEAYSLLLLDTQQQDRNDPLAIPSENASVSSRKISNQALVLGESLLLAERTAERMLAMQTVPQTGTPLPALKQDPDDDPWTATTLGLHLQKNYIKVEQPEKELDADALWVRVISPDAHEAALIANIYSEEYVNYVRETTGQRVTATRAFLEEQKARRYEELIGLENRIKQYMSRHGAAALSSEAQSTVTQIANVETSLDAARIEARTHAATLASLEAELERLSPQMAQRVASTADQEIQQTQQRIARLESELSDYYFKNPELRQNPSGSVEVKKRVDEIARLKARLDVLSKQLVEEMVSVNGVDLSAQGQGMAYLVSLNQRIAEARVALNGAEARAAALDQRLGEYTGRMRTIPMQSIELAQLERERQSTQGLYLQIEQKLQEAQIAEEAIASFAQRIRPATVPQKPAFPRPALNLGVGLVLGLLLGVGAAYVRERLDGKIHTPEGLREASFRVLGVVPNMKPTIKQQLKGAETVNVGPRAVRSTLLTYLRPHSAPSEAIRRLHAQLFATPGAARQSVLLTSPEMETGKSVLAINLAIAAAQAGQRVLLLDGDLHRPSIFKQMGITPKADVMEQIFAGGGGVSIEHFATGLPNLYALSLREQVKISSGMLGSPRTRDFFDKLRQVFEVIIVDAPPVLASADAALLATLCDSTLLIARADQTTLDALKEANRHLLSVGAVVAGTVLNDFDADKVVGYRATYKQADQYHRKAA